MEYRKGEPTRCPYCGKPLRTGKAKQCLECGTDWHDPDNLVRVVPTIPNPDRNRFGLKKDKDYVVQLCQEPCGVRYTKYREVPDEPPDPHRVLETEPASGEKFIEWGYYKYAKHLKLSNGETFDFDAHGIWMTAKEIDYWYRQALGKLNAGEVAPWVNGIAPVFPPI
ncbi:MAG TPA: hypothetical protein VNC50_20710 [Planctomycetia bacterium]|nr:hypothetical protein [Planctomycetia bacterium]